MVRLMQVHRYRCRRQARLYMHMRCHRHGFHTPLHCLYRLCLFWAALARSNLSGRLNNTGSAVRIPPSNRHDLTSCVFGGVVSGPGQVLVHRQEAFRVRHTAGCSAYPLQTCESSTRNVTSAGLGTWLWPLFAFPTKQPRSQS